MTDPNKNRKMPGTDHLKSCAGDMYPGAFNPDYTPFGFTPNRPKSANAGSGSMKRNAGMGSTDDKLKCYPDYFRGQPDPKFTGKSSPTPKYTDTGTRASARTIKPACSDKYDSGDFYPGYRNPDYSPNGFTPNRSTATFRDSAKISTGIGAEADRLKCYPDYFRGQPDPKFTGKSIATSRYTREDTKASFSNVKPSCSDKYDSGYYYPGYRNPGYTPFGFTPNRSTDTGSWGGLDRNRSSSLNTMASGSPKCFSDKHDSDFYYPGHRDPGFGIPLTSSVKPAVTTANSGWRMPGPAGRAGYQSANKSLPAMPHDKNNMYTGFVSDDTYSDYLKKRSEWSGAQQKFLRQISKLSKKEALEQGIPANISGWARSEARRVNKLRRLIREKGMDYVRNLRKKGLDRAGNERPSNAGTRLRVPYDGQFQVGHKKGLILGGSNKPENLRLELAADNMGRGPRERSIGNTLRYASGKIPTGTSRLRPQTLVERFEAPIAIAPKGPKIPGEFSCVAGNGLLIALDIFDDRERIWSEAERGQLGALYRNDRMFKSWLYTLPSGTVLPGDLDLSKYTFISDVSSRDRINYSNPFGDPGLYKWVKDREGIWHLTK